MFDSTKKVARLIRRDVHALYLASKDPRLPWCTKAAALFVAAYALSPLDLIPDFIPVIGLLDDVIVVPAGIAWVVRTIPPEIMAEHRERASAAREKPVSYRAAAVIILIWMTLITSAAWFAWRWYR